jgi:hypothetical protein
MKGNTDSSAWGRPGARRILAAGAALALAALVLAGCSSGSSSPQVASLGTSSAPGTSADPGPGTSSGTSGGSTSATIAGNVTPLLNEWAACERSHGDPDQADPTVGASGVISIIIPKGAQPAGDLHERTGTCSQYVAEAANELRAANPVAAPPDQAELLKYVACMRANGVPDYPYPDGDQTNFLGSGVDPDSPAVERVNQLCGTKLGLPTWWVNGTDTPGDIEVHTAGAPANPAPQPCLFYKNNPCSGTVTVPGNGSGSGPNG